MILFMIKEDAFKKETGENLKPISVHSDAESALLKCIKYLFPESRCILCSVHLSRNFMEQMKKKVSGSFFANEALLRVFRILIGSIYVNIFVTEIRQKILTYLFMISDRMCDKYLAKKLQIYLKYIEKNYFSEDGRFGFKNFDYYTDIVKNKTFNTSTNAIETINLKLKKKSGSGPLPFKRSLRVLKEFKMDNLLLLENAVTNNNYNRRRSTTVSREENISQLLQDYSEKSLKDQLDSVVQLSFEIGSLDKTDLTLEITSFSDTESD